MATTDVDLQVVRAKDGYWIMGEHPWEELVHIGPYDRRDDAEEDMWGIIRFFKHKDTPGWCQTER